MRPLSAHDIVRVWELGQQRPSWQRALLLLASAFSNVKLAELACLSIGRRNSYLFALRERMLGPTLDAFVECPKCFEATNFRVAISDVCRGDPSRPVEHGYTMIAEGVEIRFRPLNSQDLAAAAECDGVFSARRLLVKRCVLAAYFNGSALTVDGLPEPVVGALADELADRDPQAEVRLNLDCLTCGHNWSTNLDIASFFWSEISAWAQRLLREVCTLASAYGWREGEILSMTAARRQVYLDRMN